MSRRRLLPLAATTTVALLLSALLSPPLAAEPGPAPGSMAAIGDSITRGFNACGWYSDCVGNNWSTGTSTTVNSHYLRLRALNSAMNGRNYNVARTGAKSDALPGQAQAAVNHGVAYVTILIGANDACTSSEAGMTPVSTFQSRVESALATLKSGLPNAKVFVSSVPDIKRLWFVGKNSGSARATWSMFGICKSMLANPTSNAAADVARRDRVRQRVVEYNQVYAAACAAYGPHCTFDGNAAFNYPFVLSQVSTWDYFHPNATGQKVLAQLSWDAGFGW